MIEHIRRQAVAYLALIGPAGSIHDPHTLETTRAGELFVSKFVDRVVTTCSSGVFRLFATVDGKRVPGAVTRMAPSGTEHNSVTLNGVTREVVPAGEHVVGTGVDCESGTTTPRVGHSAARRWSCSGGRTAPRAAGAYGTMPLLARGTR